MTKVNRRIPKGIVGVAFVLVFTLMTLAYGAIGIWPSANAASNQISTSNGGDKEKEEEEKEKEEEEKDKDDAEAKVVTGSAKLSVKNDALTIVLNLKDVPAGTHAAHLHKGTCDLKFATPGGPFDPSANLTLKLGKSKNGVVKLKQTFKKAALINEKKDINIDANALVAGGWFLCVHTGALAGLAKIKGDTPEEKNQALAKLLEDPEKGPALLKDVKQIVCEPASAAIVIDSPDTGPPAGAAPTPPAAPQSAPGPGQLPNNSF